MKITPCFIYCNKKKMFCSSFNSGDASILSAATQLSAVPRYWKVLVWRLQPFCVLLVAVFLFVESEVMSIMTGKHLQGSVIPGS